MAMCRAHETLQRDYEALRHEHDLLLLKHNDSVRSCLLLLEELKERQPSVESGGAAAGGSMAVLPGRARGKAPLKQPPAAFNPVGRDALPTAGWQRQPPWPQPDPRAPGGLELAAECPPPPFERKGGDQLDELCSEEEELRDEQGEGGHSYRGDSYLGDYEHREHSETDGSGGDYEYADGEYNDGEYDDGGEYDEDDDDDLVSRAEARGFLEELTLQKQLVKHLQGQVCQLTADLSRKCEREDALVIHVSSELW